MLRIAGLIVLCAPLLGQRNLVSNGDFQSGNTSGWTTAGYAQLPQVMNFDTTGIGASPGFSLRPGCRQNQPTPCLFSIQQNVPLVQGMPYLLTADIAMINTYVLHAVDGGRVWFYVDGTLLNRVQFGNPYSKQVRRQRVTIRFTATSTGSRPLKISFDRGFTAYQNTPRHHIDNIALVLAPDQPILAPRGERQVGASRFLRLDSYGAPAARFGVFVALGSRAPVSVPGLRGSWALAAPDLLAYLARFDASGAHSIALPLANAASAAGVPLYWQGVQALATGGSIGGMVRFGVYR